MRCLIAVGLALATVSCASSRTPQPPGSPDERPRSIAEVRWNGFCFIDGHTASCEELWQYARDAIDRIEILKGATAVDRYGSEAKDGAILMSTKPSAATNRPAADRSESIFYFIDGRTASRRDVERLWSDSIRSEEECTFTHWRWP
jgi:hypothetical protein